MKNLIIVTGGAGFIGSNLIEILLKKTKFKIISIDNYSTGTKKNHIKDSRIKYIRGNTINIKKILDKKKIDIIDKLNLNSRPAELKPEIYYKITELSERDY